MMEEKKPFFRKVDWFAFWTATLVSFAVYFFTLGPSVGLEDSGELAVAGDHLGVPHPPGYPIWTMISWLFCRVFGWVTFRGYPSPAWCISLASAVAGALAAGVTAMLIVRSGSDMLRDMHGDDAALPDEAGEERRRRVEDRICWAGGVGGSLAFAFSPVMWSQAVIVEVYALGALFLMWVLLLTYRWMRRPQDKVLWLLAFVFGLGLTNYQVLLLALIPLVVIVLFKNVKLFRDFAILGIPMLLTVYGLSIGALATADHLSTEGNPVIVRHWKQTYAASADMVIFQRQAAASRDVTVPQAEMRTLRQSLAEVGQNLQKLSDGAAGGGEMQRVNEQLGLAAGALERMERQFVPAAENAISQLKPGLRTRDEKALAETRQRMASLQSLQASIQGLRMKVDFLRSESEKAGGAPAIDSLNRIFEMIASNRATGFLVKLPSPVMLWGGLVVWAAGVLGLFWFGCRRRGETDGLTREKGFCLAAGGEGALILALSPVAGKWAVLYSQSDVPLVAAGWYTAMAALLCVFALAAFLFAGIRREAILKPSPAFRPVLLVAGTVLVLWMVFLIALPSPLVPTPGFAGTLLSFRGPWLLTLGGLAVLWCLGWESKRGVVFAGLATVVQISVLVLLHKGLLLGLEHPATGWFWWAFVWNFVLLLLGGICLENGRSVAPTVFFAQLGVSFYVYMPIVSDLLNPPMNWGYPRTWEGFKHAISRGQYEKIVPTDVFTFRFLEQLGSYFSDVRMQFTLLAAPLALLPFAKWSFRWGNRRFQVLDAAIILFVICGCFVFAAEVMGEEPVKRVDKYLLSGMGVLALIGFGYMLLDEFDSLIRRAWEERSMLTGWIVGCILLGLLAGVAALIGSIVLACLTSAGAAPSLPDKVLAGAVGVVLAVAPLFFWTFYGRREAEEKAGMRPGFDPVARQWLIGTVLFFLVMSVMLIALANPKGDIQDGFIQKVKFISSHGIFAVWMGYGLIFGLATVETLIRCLKLPPALAAAGRGTALALALATAAIPIWENYMNDNLVFAMGAAEQNGHDFGWQFGMYQLEGAQGIIPELDPEEEPLPNPFYPEAMPEGAVFFGGTDPGRFVPTYMIYSAKVRPDVFLITQNALADATYMNVTRDLYGDQIWIPSQWDSMDVFNRVSRELADGTRQSGAEVRTINGRIQISGALGVMEVNADLTKDIFERNKAKHDFFIEESYVIQWMYPYLTPHGLIMKINAEPTPITPAIVRNDQDFWDWYTRRLTDRPDFRRDFVAQKSFCKLRVALAGLYMQKRMEADAGKAFREALWLYPVGTEAVFRYLQEVLLNKGEPGVMEGIRLIREFNSRDPNNERGERLLAALLDAEEHYAVVREVTEKIRNGSATTPDVVQLAESYYQLRNTPAAVEYWKQAARAPDLSLEDQVIGAIFLGSVEESVRNTSVAPLVRGSLAESTRLFDRIPPESYASLDPDQQLALSSLAGKINRPQAVVYLLSLYTRNNKANWQAYLNLGVAQWILGRETEACQAVIEALQIGQNEALAFLTASEALRPLYEKVMQYSQQNRLPTGPADRRR